MRLRYARSGQDRCFQQDVDERGTPLLKDMEQQSHQLK